MPCIFFFLNQVFFLFGLAVVPASTAAFSPRETNSYTSLVRLNENAFVLTYDELRRSILKEEIHGL